MMIALILATIMLAQHSNHGRTTHRPYEHKNRAAAARADAIVHCTYGEGAEEGTSSISVVVVVGAIACATSVS